MEKREFRRIVWRLISRMPFRDQDFKSYVAVGRNELMKCEVSCNGKTETVYTYRGRAYKDEVELLKNI